ncbi:MAG: hypothetical protein IJ196_04640 [Prevotella sp.]|nr:hypothetical protein [Prevotella sp.]
MDYVQAKNKIMALWKEGRTAYKKVRQEEYKQMYYAVLPHLKDRNQEWQRAVGYFMIHGAMSYDRFVGLRPKVADDEQYEMYCRFLNTLQKMDGRFMGRTAFFHLHKIQWDIYRECSLKPYDEEQEAFLAQCEENIRKMDIPQDDANVAVHLEQQERDLLELIENIRGGQIRTSIRTTLPYKMTNTDAEVHLVIDGVDVDVRVKHHSQGCTIPIAQVAEGTTMATTGPSKWTTTTCEIEIEAHCLIDILEERPKVIFRGGADNGGYWTAVLDFTFKVICAIWTYIHQQDEVTGAWPPLPNDIQYMDCRVYAGDKEYDHVFASNPALVYHFTSLNKPTAVIDIGDSEKPLWSVYTFMFAKVFAESGQLKEAIFWLNVSVEALVEEFIQRVAKTPEMLQEIEGEENKFDTAETILAEQFPEMKGKVKWPDIGIHTSVFTKLKRAIALSGLTVSVKDVTKKYSQVNAKRNALFHGRETDITVVDVEKAFAAYGWLKEHIGTSPKS